MTIPEEIKEEVIDFINIEEDIFNRQDNENVNILLSNA